MTKKLFHADVVIYGTAYVKAETAEEAARIAREKLSQQEVPLEEVDDFIVGLRFDDPRLPDVSLSPVATTAKGSELLPLFEEFEECS